ncbi:hypothetical protein [Catenulispora pinisilvae]|uniref:hypothetical protein n=1 Tax=Catenulispora pinisilvae TaxID=2705253 RepID=UPI001E4BC7A7|nr:hypothetical protein [Catenulispora pinisilvae]
MSVEPKKARKQAARLTAFSPEFADKLFGQVSRIAALPQVKEAVEANHDTNRWWPLTVTDPRMRMLAAGWSTRIGNSMVSTYAAVLAEADALGFDKLTALDDEELAEIVHPLGLRDSRIAYLRSLEKFVDRLADEGTAVEQVSADELISRIAAEVDQASFKVGQCAALYVGGYHCDVIPVDSGMVDKLAPFLGITLPSGSAAHESMRHLLQQAVTARISDYRQLIADLEYEVTIASGVVPTWWTHLVLIYFKRSHLNRPRPDLCTKRPACPALFACEHTTATS